LTHWIVFADSFSDDIGLTTLSTKHAPPLGAHFHHSDTVDRDENPAQVTEEHMGTQSSLHRTDSWRHGSSSNSASTNGTGQDHHHDPTGTGTNVYTLTSSHSSDKIHPRLELV
jgi:alanine racemase